MSPEAQYIADTGNNLFRNSLEGGKYINAQKWDECVLLGRVYDKVMLADNVINLGKQK